MTDLHEQGRTNCSDQSRVGQNRSDGKGAARQGWPGVNWASDAAMGRPMGLASLSSSGENRRQFSTGSGAAGTSKDHTQLNTLKPMPFSEPNPVAKPLSSPPAQAGTGQASSGANWASAAAKGKMVGFASVGGSGETHRSITAGGQSVGASKGWTPMNRNPSTSFGKPGFAMEGFSNPPSQPAAQPQFVERSLEDVYREYPDKRLRGIGQEGIQPAIMVLGQIAEDATFAWIRTWCPLMNWNKVLSSLTSCTKGEQAFIHRKAKCPEETVSSTATNVPKAGGEKGKENLYLVPEEALDSGDGMRTVVELFHRCAVKLPSPRPEQLPDLTRMIDDCTRLCQALRDGERAALLAEARRTVQWIAIGLDCKKLDIYRDAARDLRRNNDRYQVLQVLGEDLAVTRAGAQFRTARRTAERRILDQATEAFDRHREAFTVDLLTMLDQLLKFPPGNA